MILIHGVDVKMCKLKKTWKGIIWASCRSPFPETGDLNFIQITSKLRKTYAWKLNMMYKNDFYDKKYKKSSYVVSNYLVTVFQKVLNFCCFFWSGDQHRVTLVRSFHREITQALDRWTLISPCLPQGYVFSGLVTMQSSR